MVYKIIRVMVLMSEKKNIVIERIATPDGDVPKAEGVIEAFNLIISKIAELNKKINENLKLIGGKDLSEITTDLSITKDNIIELKSKIKNEEKEINSVREEIQKINSWIEKIDSSLSQITNGDEGIILKSNSNTDQILVDIKEIIKDFNDSLKNFRNLDEQTPKKDQENAIFNIIQHENIKITLDILGNYQENKEILLSNGQLVKLPKQIYENPKILLYGPSGNGKTSMVLAVAKELELNIIEINLPLLLANNVKDQFEFLNNIFFKFKNEENLTPCILLIENVQLFYYQKNSKMILTNFLNLLDHINLYSNKVFIICTTNEINALDYSFISKFDKLCEFNYPSEIARSEILYKLLKNLKLNENLDIDLLISNLSSDEKLSGFTCRDIAMIVQQAHFKLLKEEKDVLDENDIYQSYQQIFNQKSRFSTKKIESFQSKDKIIVDIDKKTDLEEMESRIDSLNTQLIINKKFIKNALRLALSDNYNLINRLVKFFELENRPLDLEEIQKVSGISINILKKALTKNPYNIIFPKIGNKFTIAFSKDMFDEIISEFELNNQQMTE